MGQTWIFLMSILLGAALGVCYDIFRVLRVAFYHPTALVVVEDLLFSAICAISTLLYLIYADCGEIRMFILIGELLGFILYYCTVGMLVIGAAKGIVAVIHWILQMLCRTIMLPILRAGRTMQKFLHKILLLPADWLKRKVENSNLHLKKHRSLVYNLKKRLLCMRQNKNKKEQE